MKIVTAMMRTHLKAIIALAAVSSLGAAPAVADVNAGAALVQSHGCMGCHGAKLATLGADRGRAADRLAERDRDEPCPDERVVGRDREHADLDARQGRDEHDHDARRCAGLDREIGIAIRAEQRLVGEHRLQRPVELAARDGVDALGRWAQRART